MPTALVAVAPDRFALQDRPLPEPRSGQSLVRVARVGLCGTDLHILDGSHPRARFPLALGHEIVGWTDGGEGDATLVVVDPLIACGTCVACRLGERHVCARLRLVGIDADGGLAGTVAVDADRVHPVPAGVDADLAVLAEPLAVAVHAIRRAAIARGEVVVIVGAGPIGLLLAFVARRAGVGDLFVSEPAAARRAFATSLGLELLDASDPVGDLARCTDGEMADVALDAAGAPPVAGILPHLVRPAGRIGLVGVYGRPVEVDLQAVVFREQTIVGNRVYTPDDIDRALTLLRDDGEAIRSLVTEIVPLTGVAAAFERFRAGQGVKFVVTFEAT
jgi:(R,R)-butanediol dehydrogenase/meso-butanediol dehydrogenase/diacetyl reductase